MFLNNQAKLFVLFLLTLVWPRGTFAFELRNGDLLFQESVSSESVGKAIKGVTQSVGDYHFTHVGIVYIPAGKDSIYVIEAVPPAVRMVPLVQFLFPNGKARLHPVSVVGRVREAYRNSISGALQEALRLVGKQYDYGFVLDNDKYYCSELIYDVFRKANAGTPVFELNRMTFKRADSGETDKLWISYFNEKGLSIPEGEWGINPGAMSRSKVVEMLGEITTETVRLDDSGNRIYGLLTDSCGRCVHYGTARDIVANKCYICRKYYSCYQCHNLCENHPLAPWPILPNDSIQRIVLCGNCFSELTYGEYSKNYSCPRCHKEFNPKCALHKSIYFSFSSSE